MRRTKQPTERIASAILTSDWHLRETHPICRTDDFFATQWRKVKFVADLQARHQCPVLHAGDLYDYWKPSPHLLSLTMQSLPHKFMTAYGQHDLPQHSLALAHKCGVYALECAGAVQIAGFHYGETPTNSRFLVIDNRVILLWHKMVWTGKLPYPGCLDVPALDILDKYTECDMIISGDNHKPFVVEDSGRLLVNPGSLSRQTSDQIDHEPRVYLWFADTNTVDAVYIPIEQNVISREHIDCSEKRDARIEAFVRRLSQEWDVGLDFIGNLDRFEKENSVAKPVMDIVRKAIEPNAS